MWLKCDENLLSNKKEDAWLPQYVENFEIYNAQRYLHDSSRNNLHLTNKAIV